MLFEKAFTKIANKVAYATGTPHGVRRLLQPSSSCGR